jgi:cytochrome b6-f complex iron-sulfur subunit
MSFPEQPPRPAGPRDGRDEQGVPRRTFVNAILGGGLVATLASILYPIVDFIMPPEQEEAMQTTVVAAKVGELTPNSGKVFRFGTKPAILVYSPSGEYRAFTAICTHLQCTVQYRPDFKHIWCACHNGHFDLTGKNIAGPPPRPLEAYKVDIRGEDIIVSRVV